METLGMTGVFHRCLYDNGILEISISSQSYHLSLSAKLSIIDLDRKHFYNMADQTGKMAFDHVEHAVVPDPQKNR